MEKSGHTGDGTLEHFNNYKYAPSRPQTQQSHTIFAITSNGSLNNNNNSTVINENFSPHNTNGYAINKNISDGLPIADC